MRQTKEELRRRAQNSRRRYKIKPQELPALPEEPLARWLLKAKKAAAAPAARFLLIP
jgi:hypothetical protein